MSADEKASLFSAHFEARWCRDNFQQPYSCDLSLVLCSVVFRSIFVCSLLLDLYGGGWMYLLSFICLSAVAVEDGSSYFATALLHHAPPKVTSMLVLFVIFEGLF